MKPFAWIELIVGYIVATAPIRCRLVELPEKVEEAAA